MSNAGNERVLHERVDISLLPSSLKGRVQAHAGASWSTMLDGIADLRVWLLNAQKYRCVYCQVAIPGVSVGLCELDHILPKGASSKCDEDKANTNAYENRQHTLGYPAYTFVVTNLAASCKQCNSSKKSFDPLADRSKPLIGFPTKDADYAWVHPHFDNYSKCIVINEHWLYSWLNSKGEHTIKACKLDKGDVLARRHFSEGLATRSKDLDHFLFQLIGGVDEIGHRDIVKTLCDRFDLSEELAGTLVELWSNARRQASELERIGRETCVLLGKEMLGRTPKPPPAESEANVDSSAVLSEL